MVRYVGYHLPNQPHEPAGLAPKFPGFSFAVGLCVHKGLEVLLSSKGDIHLALEVMAKELDGYFSFDPLVRLEMGALCQGMVYGWYRQRYPVLLQDYEIIETEKTYTWKFSSDFDYTFRVDALLARRDDHRLMILDFKTAKKCDAEWARMFEHDLQPILYNRALEEILGITNLLGMQFEGLVKGHHRVDTARKSPFYGMTIQYSPYCYGYESREGNLQAEYHASLTRVRSWEKLPIPRWYDEVIANTREAEDLFAVVPEVKPGAYITEATLASILSEEQLFAAKVQRCQHVAVHAPHLLQATENQLFERHTQHCLKYGSDYRCFAYDLCWVAGARSNPAEIDLIPRQPNHTEELT